MVPFRLERGARKPRGKPEGWRVKADEKFLIIEMEHFSIVSVIFYWFLRLAACLAAQTAETAFSKRNYGKLGF